MRAKFRVDEVADQDQDQFIVSMSAVTADGGMENSDFNKYTPSGTFEMFVDNPKAKGFFEVDKEHLVVYGLSVLAKEQLIASKYAKEAIKKYNIDGEKPMPTKL